MKTYCKNLEPSIDLINVAYTKWAKGESGKKNEWRVYKEYESPENLKEEILKEWVNRTLKCREIKYYPRKDPSNGKLRIIAVESVKQQIIDYLFIECVSPLLEAKRGFYQIASVKKKGQVFGRRRIAPWVNKCHYAIKSDVSKCYESVDHELVMILLGKYVKNYTVLYLAEYILSTYRCGLNIGSYFSLCIMTFILSFAYHFLEDLHKERRGERINLILHQVWHMDDVILFGNNKKSLKKAMEILQKYCLIELGLSLKKCKVLNLLKESVTLCGYTFSKWKVTVSNGTFLRAKRAFNRFLRKRSIKLARRVCSYYGWFKHANCRVFMEIHGVWKALCLARKLISKRGKQNGSNNGKTPTSYRRCAA